MEEYMFDSVTAIEVSTTDLLAKQRKGRYFRDALSIPFSKPQLTPGNIQHRIFAYMPIWGNKLMSLGNAIVGCFGLTVEQDSRLHGKEDLQLGDSAGFMKVIYCEGDEIISYAQDKHMDFYLSVTKRDGHAIISTLVNKKIYFGRLYVNFIVPFHWVIARTVLAGAVKKGRV